MTHALIVDDDMDAAATLRALVADVDFTVAIAHTLRDAQRQIALQQPDLILLDARLPDGSGMELFADPELLADSEVVLITGHGALDAAAPILPTGVTDCLTKPIRLPELEQVLSRFTKPPLRRPEPADPIAPVAATGRFGLLLGNSAPMQRVYQQISRVADTGVTVLVTGESGTGKELVAQTLHTLSRRRSQAFLAVNCGAISPNLIESEIFGHEKGSFTGADRQHLGFFERASGGTLFLDEITEMPADLQVKLLRVLETGTFMRVGSTQTQVADVRVVAATNRDLEQAVACGKLREDLMYRLNVFPLEMPPLRERLSDVPLLAEHFLAGIAAQEGPARRFSAAALDRLCRHTWPGNVRELRNAVQRAYVMATTDTIDDEWLPRAKAGALVGAFDPVGLDVPAEAVDEFANDVVTLPIGTSLAAAERSLILSTLRHHAHQKERTAAALGISLKTLYNRLKEYAAESAHCNGTVVSAPASSVRVRPARPAPDHRFGIGEGGLASGLT